MDQSTPYRAQLLPRSFSSLTAFIHTLMLATPQQNPFQTSPGWELGDPGTPQWLKRPPASTSTPGKTDPQKASQRAPSDGAREGRPRGMWGRFKPIHAPGEAAARAGMLHRSNEG